MSFAIMSTRLFEAHVEDTARAIRLNGAIANALGVVEELKAIKNPQLYVLCFDEAKALREKLDAVMLECARERSRKEARAQTPRLEVITGGRS